MVCFIIELLRTETTRSANTAPRLEHSSMVIQRHTKDRPNNATYLLAININRVPRSSTATAALLLLGININSYLDVEEARGVVPVEDHHALLVPVHADLAEQPSERRLRSVLRRLDGRLRHQAKTRTMPNNFDFTTCAWGLLL